MTALTKLIVRGNQPQTAQKEGQINNWEGVLRNCEGQSELMLERK